MPVSGNPRLAGKASCGKTCSGDPVSDYGAPG